MARQPDERLQSRPPPCFRLAIISGPYCPDLADRLRTAVLGGNSRTLELIDETSGPPQ